MTNDEGGVPLYSITSYGHAKLTNAQITSSDGAALCSGDYKLRIRTVQSEAEGMRRLSEGMNPELSIDVVARLVSYDPTLQTRTATTKQLMTRSNSTANMTTTATLIQEGSDTMITYTTITNKTVETCDSNGVCSLDEVTEEHVSTREASPVILFTKPPPSSISANVPFTVSLRTVTETGLPLVGEHVQALLLAPLGSHATLGSGPMAGEVVTTHGFSDAQGELSLRLGFTRGSLGNYTLLFGGRGIAVRQAAATQAAIRAGEKQWENLVTALKGAGQDGDPGAGAAQNLLGQRAASLAQTQMEEQAASIEECAKQSSDEALALTSALQTAVDAGVGSTADALQMIALAQQTVESIDSAQSCLENANLDFGAMATTPPQDGQGDLAGGDMLAALIFTANSRLDALFPPIVVEAIESAEARIFPQLGPAIYAERVGTFETQQFVDAFASVLRDTLGVGMPAPASITLRNDVGSVELTAPLTGYSVPTDATLAPDIHLGSERVGTSSCVEAGYPEFLPALASGAPFSVETIDNGCIGECSALPLASPLFQVCDCERG